MTADHQPGRCNLKSKHERSPSLSHISAILAYALFKEWMPISIYKGNSGISRLSLAALAALIFAAGCGGGGGGGGGAGGGSGSNGGNSGPPDTTAPTVTAMTPGEDNRGIATNSRLTATFSETMVAAAINTENFRLTDGTNAIPGTVSFDASNHIAVFRPTGGLAPDKRYTATVITGIKDLSGNPLTTDFAWCFVTGGTPDSTAPGVTSTIPVNAATDVAINRKVSATFSEEMNSSTLTPASFTLAGPGATPVSGTVTYLSGTAVFTPARAFASNTAYTATITTGVMDLVGNASLANVTWSFTTGATADTTAPVAISTNPVSAETSVAISRTINITFSEPMDPATITTANFTVAGPGTLPVVGTVAFDAINNTATFTRILHLTTPVDFHPTPVSYLDANTTYTATLTTRAKDMAGNALANNLVWSFITAP